MKTVAAILCGVCFAATVTYAFCCDAVRGAVAALFVVVGYRVLREIAETGDEAMSQGGAR